MQEKRRTKKVNIVKVFDAFKLSETIKAFVAEMGLIN